jgi:mannose-6-phosphate isomerase-like protein (cupin superfamily)
MYKTSRLPDEPDATAPDGSDVRILLALAGGGVAHFELAAGESSVPVHHRTVEEIWYFVGGEGLMWRSALTDGADEPVEVRAGVCITIPLGTHFQLRANGKEPLRAVGITMPPWPGDGEAIRSRGYWPPTVAPGPGLADS